jgi:hypothetical protein
MNFENSLVVDGPVAGPASLAEHQRQNHPLREIAARDARGWTGQGVVSALSSSTY